MRLKVGKETVGVRRPISANPCSCECSRLGAESEPSGCAAQHSIKYIFFLVDGSLKSLRNTSEPPGRATSRLNIPSFGSDETRCNSHRVAPSTRYTRRLLSYNKAERRHSPLVWTLQIAFTFAGRLCTRAALSNGACDPPDERKTSCSESVQ